MWRFWDIVVDLLQEAPYFFAERVKSDSDSGVKRTEKEKRELHGGTPCKILVVCFS